MAEKITTYDLKNPEVKLPADRDEYYKDQMKEISKTGEATRSVEAVALLLFNKDKEIILQKRSHTKNHNPYLIDKAVGGHIKYGDSPMFTLMVETVQELRVPSIVLRTKEDFKKTFGLLSNYLDNVALVKKLDHDTFLLDRSIDGKKYSIPWRTHLYIGVYSGATKPVDKEASGVLYYSLDILKKEMDVQPDNFTHDLVFYLDKYKKEIDEFLDHLKTD